MRRQDHPIWRLVRHAAGVAKSTVVALIDVLVLRPLNALFTFIVALVLLFEEWGWQPLVRGMAWLARWRPIAAAEQWMASLPPYGALAVFVLPSALLLPVKLAAVWLLAHGQPIAASAVLVFAKITGTGLVARIFMLTKPQLMRIGWFAYAYSVFIPWKEALFERVRASWAWRWGRVVKQMARRWLRRRWERALG